MIDRAGRKRLLGFGYLLMGVMMSVLIVMLTIKVTFLTDTFLWTELKLVVYSSVLLTAMYSTVRTGSEDAECLCVCHSGALIDLQLQIHSMLKYMGVNLEFPNRSFSFASFDRTCTPGCPISTLPFSSLSSVSMD